MKRWFNVILKIIKQIRFEFLEIILVFKKMDLYHLVVHSVKLLQQYYIISFQEKL